MIRDGNDKQSTILEVYTVWKLDVEVLELIDHFLFAVGKENLIGGLLIL
jgi:hypothetical protein